MDLSKKNPPGTEDVPNEPSTSQVPTSRDSPAQKNIRMSDGLSQEIETFRSDIDKLHSEIKVLDWRAKILHEEQQSLYKDLTEIKSEPTGVIGDSTVGQSANSNSQESTFRRSTEKLDNSRSKEMRNEPSGMLNDSIINQLVISNSQGSSLHSSTEKLNNIQLNEVRDELSEVLNYSIVDKSVNSNSQESSPHSSAVKLNNIQLNEVRDEPSEVLNYSIVEKSVNSNSQGSSPHSSTEKLNNIQLNEVHDEPSEVLNYSIVDQSGNTISRESSPTSTEKLASQPKEICGPSGVLNNSLIDQSISSNSHGSSHSSMKELNYVQPNDNCDSTMLQPDPLLQGKATETTSQISSILRNRLIAASVDPSICVKNLSSDRTIQQENHSSNQETICDSTDLRVPNNPTINQLVDSNSLKRPSCSSTKELNYNQPNESCDSTTLQSDPLLEENATKTTSQEGRVLRNRYVSASVNPSISTKKSSGDLKSQQENRSPTWEICDSTDLRVFNNPTIKQSVNSNSQESPLPSSVKEQKYVQSSDNCDSTVPSETLLEENPTETTPQASRVLRNRSVNVSINPTKVVKHSSHDLTSREKHRPTEEVIGDSTDLQVRNDPAVNQSVKSKSREILHCSKRELDYSKPNESRDPTVLQSDPSLKKKTTETTTQVSRVLRNRSAKASANSTNAVKCPHEKTSEQKRRSPRCLTANDSTAQPSVRPKESITPESETKSSDTVSRVLRNRKT